MSDMPNTVTLKEVLAMADLAVRYGEGFRNAGLCRGDSFSIEAPNEFVEPIELRGAAPDAVVVVLKAREPIAMVDPRPGRKRDVGRSARAPRRRVGRALGRQLGKVGDD